MTTSSYPPPERADDPDTLRETPKSKKRDSYVDDYDFGNRFTSEERITSSLRLRSIAPVYRAFIGFIAFIPSAWRGPIAALLFVILGFLASQVTPQIVEWMKAK